MDFEIIGDMRYCEAFAQDSEIREYQLLLLECICLMRRKQHAVYGVYDNHGKVR